MSDCNVMVIKIGDRQKNAEKVQKILTDFGCMIRTRLGLHEAGNICADEGLLILQLSGECKMLAELEDVLNKTDGVKAKLVQLD
jgi:hypothetical protein